MARKAQDTRTCFVIMPFGQKPDPARDNVPFDFDEVYDDLIAPAVKNVAKRGLRIKPLRSDKVSRAGLIHERMIQCIADADVAVVDITALNANVFYELGVRHALRDRVTVVVRRKGTQNPFNIGGLATIDYDMEPAAARELSCTTIANYIYNGLTSGSKDSLVHAMLPGLKPSVPPRKCNESLVEEYEVPEAKGLIGIVTGNLRHVNLNAHLNARPIAIWVSSENINMQMARPYEESISGMIRYLGARKDETGAIVEDTIVDELANVMGSRQIVNPGEVVATGAGCLAETHNVDRIFHAAAVYGVVGTGFHPIENVEQCVTNALVRADREQREKGKPTDTSILFPLLGTGTARADLTSSAKRQIGAVLSYFRSRDGSTFVDRVYFLAPTQNHLAGMQVALAELGIERKADESTRAHGRRKTKGAPAHAVAKPHDSVPPGRDGVAVGG